jgi:hypothetical protein
MSFEQPASLNKYLASPIPHDWNFRWKLFKLFLPLALFGALSTAQIILLRAWLSDDWGHWLFFRILIVVAIFPGGLILHVELGSWLERKRPKTIKFEGAYVRFGSGLAQRVSWQKIISWQFNHLANEETLRVATMEYKWGRKVRLRSIVLEKTQTEQLIAEVKSRKQEGHLAFSILDDRSNFIPKTFEFKSRGSAVGFLLFAGAFLLFDGVPFLFIGLGLHGDSPTPVPVNHNGSFARFIRSHFSSFAEFQHFCLVTGLILCASGLILIMWGFLLAKPKTVRTEKIKSVQ